MNSNFLLTVSRKYIIHIFHPSLLTFSARRTPQSVVYMSYISKIRNLSTMRNRIDKNCTQQNSTDFCLNFSKSSTRRKSSPCAQFNKPPEIYHSHSLQATFMPSLFRPFSSLCVLSKFATFFYYSHSSLLLADRQCFKGLNHGIIFAI